MTKTNPRTLLRSSLRAHAAEGKALTSLRDVIALGGSPKAPRKASSPALTLPEVLAQAEKQQQTGGLVFLPALVRTLGGDAARSAVHKRLLEGERRGLLELRPESGLARLSEEELAFCIPGPQGSRLSWARLLDAPLEAVHGRPPRSAPLPLSRFAQIVRELAGDEPSKARFGREKVFISSLWERARGIPELRSLDERSFKDRLVDAHRGGLLRLSRADLTSAMSPSMVEASEVPYLNAVFHFVNDERGKREGT